jgi:hypothetical protein
MNVLGIAFSSSSSSSEAARACVANALMASNDAIACRRVDRKLVSFAGGAVFMRAWSPSRAGAGGLVDRRQAGAKAENAGAPAFATSARRW